mgnify:FL=1
MEIKIGYTLAKPVETQAQCDAYAAMAKAVDAHNAACAVGDTLWSIEEEADCYKVVDGGTVPDPADLPEPEPTLKEQLEALQAAQTDTNAMMVDQEYRITMLELGASESENEKTE